MLPFTQDQFLQVFADYNVAVWPAQLLAYALAVLMLPWFGEDRRRLAAIGLAILWIWTGIAYHWLHFTRINPAAWLFGGLFVAQGVLLLVAGSGTRRLAFGARGGAAFLGWALVAYAAVVYPLLGIWAGHAYPALPVFGVTPCPLTLFTFGMLLLARPPVAGWLLVVPVLWSLVGGSAAFLLRVPQDAVLLLSGLAVLPILARNRRPPVAPQA